MVVVVLFLNLNLKESGVCLVLGREISKGHNNFSFIHLASANQAYIYTMTTNSTISLLCLGGNLLLLNLSNFAHLFLPEGPTINEANEASCSACFSISPVCLLPSPAFLVIL